MQKSPISSGSVVKNHRQHITHRKKAFVALDHRNFDNYRLYTLIVTYENDAESKTKPLDARSYMCYYDANGKLRVFYNNYNDNASYYGGCMYSFDQVSRMNSLNQ